MSIETRYFSTAAAGAGDGTTWADRAALIVTGAWSTVITGFTFDGTNSLLCLIGPGTYAPTAALAVTPHDNGMLFMHGCDSSGVMLEVPDPDWTSAQPATWDADLPHIVVTTNNVAVSTSVLTVWRLLKFSSAVSTTAGMFTQAAAIDWCSITVSASNTSAFIIGSACEKVTNCYLSMTGASYKNAMALTTIPPFNTRMQGVTGTSGDRSGIQFAGAGYEAPMVGCTIFGFGGHGYWNTTTNATHRHLLYNCVIANNGGSGVLLHSTNNQTQQHRIMNCMITGNGVYGVDAQSEANCIISNCRLRNNATADLNGFANYPVNQSINTSAGSDGSEYVSAAAFDFRILRTAAIRNRGYGVSQQPAGGGRRVLMV